MCELDIYIFQNVDNHVEKVSQEIGNYGNIIHSIPNERRFRECLWTVEYLLIYQTITKLITQSGTYYY